MNKEPLYVEIAIKESLDERWLEWFQGLAFSAGPQDSALMRGEVPDQAALYAVLERIRNLNLTLLSVKVQE